MTNQTEITLSDSAKLHIEKVLAKEPDGLGLRLAVKTTGCSGNQYVIETAKSINEEDKTIEFEGIKIVVDKNSFTAYCITDINVTPAVSN